MIFVLCTTVVSIQCPVYGPVREEKTPGGKQDRRQRRGMWQSDNLSSGVTSLLAALTALDRNMQIHHSHLLLSSSSPRTRSFKWGRTILQVLGHSDYYFARWNDPVRQANKMSLFWTKKFWMSSIPAFLELGEACRNIWFVLETHYLHLKVELLCSSQTIHILAN